jgi:hypothetical protein
MAQTRPTHPRHQRTHDVKHLNWAVYVYRLASMHGWRRLHHQGRVYYDVLDVATALQRPA